MASPAVLKYLYQHSDPVIELAPKTPRQNWSHSVAIPAYREGEELLKTLQSLAKASSEMKSRILIALVLNLPKECDKSSLDSHLQCLEDLSIDKAKNFAWAKLHNLDLAVFNLWGHLGFTQKEGVGRARKIGGDFLLNYWAQGAIHASFYFSSDADVRFPQSYFSLQLEKGHSAQCLPFVHTPQNLELTEAIGLYDTYLRYYRKGLEWAESPYSFFTLGSNLMISFENYAQVRGFPLRQAGEDFYLLNKLQKIQPVSDLTEGPPLQLSGRASLRVPFGTGASVFKISEMLRNGESYCVEDPQAFERLKSVHASLRKLSQHRELNFFFTSLEDEDTRIFFKAQEKSFEQLLKNTATADSLYRQLFSHFDAFQTLKLLHHWERNGLEKIPLHRIKTSFFDAPSTLQNFYNANK